MPRSPRAALLASACLTLASHAAAQVAPRPSLAEPSLSPDGKEIVFTSGGDVWTAPAEGGEARLLVADPALESRPLFSPDGKRVAFVSTRTGNGDVYVMELATGALRRVTFDDAADVLDAWSRDGRWLYLSGSSRDISGMNDVYRVSVDPSQGSGSATPLPVAADRYASEYWAAPSPDGSAIAITARGTVSGQWWRRGHSHLDESEIWLVSALGAAAPTYTPVTTGGAKSAWAMWAPDGRTLYFMSDRDGAENLWAQPMNGLAPNGSARRLTSFTNGRVLWPSIAADGRTIVFERDFAIWRADPATGQARQVALTLRGAPAGGAVERVSQAGGTQEMVVAPDGRKVAFIVRGEVFASASRADAQGAIGDAFRVTSTPGLEEELAWAPDSRRLAYASDRDGRWRIWLYDFSSRTERALTTGGEGGPLLSGDVAPRWSPDGRELAFTRGGRELRVLDVASGRERLVTTSAFAVPPYADRSDLAWSPDGRWIAYMSDGSKGFTNAAVVDAQGGAPPHAISFLANSNGGSLAWAPNGTYVLFLTNQRTEQTQVARVDLLPRTPRFREDQFRDLFSTTTQGPNRRDSSATPRPQTTERALADTTRPDSARRPAAATVDSGRRTRIVFDDIRTRLSLLPLGLNVNGIALSPDGRQLAFVSNVAGQSNLYTWSMDELAPTDAARQVTSSAGFKADVQWSPDGRELYYRENGRMSAIAIDSRTPRSIAPVAEMDVDFAQVKYEVFAQAWSYLRDQFYDPKYHGADWNAVRERWAPQVAGASTAPELRRILSLMVGELNASHSGVNGPAAAGPSTGRLAVRFDRVASERDGMLHVAEVLPLGPAALAGVRVGDAIAVIDGRPLTRATNLDEILAFKIGRRVALGLVGADGARREVAVLPVNLNTEKGLLYRAWVESRRAYVARVSNGTLGYVHMPDMSEGALNQLYQDLDAENQTKQGVIVDIRNNNGGFVNAYALDVFNRRPYLTMQQRGFGAAPARAQLGQRALELPTALVTNQHSLSDAEDFTEGWRTLGLGPVVGEPTAGWIIFTSNQPLIDGTVVRLPSSRITDHAGKDMELHPRPVDVPVTRPVGESYSGKDSQLDAAVQELMKRLR